MDIEAMLPQIIAKFREVPTWPIPGFVIEPLDALCLVGKDALSLCIYVQGKDLCALQADTTEQLARSFMAAMSLLFVDSTPTHPPSMPR